jgi:hypothetical protein
MCFRCSASTATSQAGSMVTAHTSALLPSRIISQAISSLTLVPQKLVGGAHGADVSCRCGRSMHKGTTSGLQSRCKACTREASLGRLHAIRSEVLAVYSDGRVSCECCGERDERFLALDHIEGIGPRQPGVRTGGNVFYVWLKKQGFPSGLRVLCHNCNCAMGRDRACPHTASEGEWPDSTDQFGAGARQQYVNFSNLT